MVDRHTFLIPYMVCYTVYFSRRKGRSERPEREMQCWNTTAAKYVQFAGWGAASSRLLETRSISLKRRTPPVSKVSSPMPALSLPLNKRFRLERRIYRVQPLPSSPPLPLLQNLNRFAVWSLCLLNRVVRFCELFGIRSDCCDNVTVVFN
jgi:hypothetical protein